jgi:hypothetical protein
MSTLLPFLLTLLRLIPLLSSTASFTHAYMEYLTTSSFLSPAPTSSPLSKLVLKSYTPSKTPTNAVAVAAAKEIAAPIWFVNFFSKAVWSVIGFNSITLLSSAANLWVQPEGLEKGRTYYLTGLIAACAHYVFVPFVMPSVERLYRMCAAQEKGNEEVGKEGKSAVKSMREWVGVHRIRMGSADLVAWGSFLVGVVRVLTP